MNTNGLPKFLILITLFLYLSACTPANLTINNPWARSAGVGETSAIYFEIINPSNRSDALLTAQTDVAEMVELHQSQMNTEGVMTMHHQNEIAIPANSKVLLEPGGYHIMLMGLKKELKPGDTFPLTLTFQTAGTIEVQVLVNNP